MICTNLKIHSELPFSEYLALPGYSYSGIKGAAPVTTAKMSLGTAVHNYLLTPEAYGHENTEVVKPLALALKEKLGALLQHLKPEVAVTAEFISQNFCMQYKGRIDLCILGRIVIDIKVSEMPIVSGISFFGYDRQLNGYAAAINAPLIFIVSINPKTKKVTVTNIPIHKAWWEYQVVQKGEPIL